MTFLLWVLISSMGAATDGGVFDSDAGTPDPAMQLEIVGLRNEKGHVLLALYRAGDGFTKAGATAFRKQTVAARAGLMTVEFKDLPRDSYAIALIHDENDNLKLDSGFFGLPLEGYCFSRGATGFMGPPSFEAAAVSHSAGSGTHKLVVKY